MSEAGSGLPAALVQGLLRVDDPLLAERYRAGLEAIGVRAPALALFHLDAAGFSPRLADALGDPFYLGGGPLEARAIVIGAAQLQARLVHPALGFAAQAFLAWRAAHGSEIGALTLREPLLVEIEPVGAPVAMPRDLADPEVFDLHARTPSGVLAALPRLEAMKREFLESDRRWLDDAFIGELGALAARVRGLPALPEGFERSRRALGPLFFAPAFGGAYAIEEPGASGAAAVTRLLVAAPAAGGDPPARSARGRRIELLPLTAETALATFERYGIARVDPVALREQPDALDRLRHWLAVDACLARDPSRAPDALDARAVARVLRDPAELPPEHRELDELARRLGAERARIDPDALAPLNRLRIAVPTTPRPSVRRFVRHVQAFLDPLDLGRAWQAAPDLFFARLPRLAAPRRAYLARWLEESAPSRRGDAER